MTEQSSQEFLCIESPENNAILSNKYVAMLLRFFFRKQEAVM